MSGIKLISNPETDRLAQRRRRRREPRRPPCALCVFYEKAICVKANVVASPAPGRHPAPDHSSIRTQDTIQAVPVHAGVRGTGPDAGKLCGDLKGQDA